MAVRKTRANEFAHGGPKHQGTAKTKGGTPRGRPSVGVKKSTNVKR